MADDIETKVGSSVELNAPALLVIGLRDVKEMLKNGFVGEALKVIAELQETSDRLLKQHRLWQKAGVVVPAGLGWTDLLGKEAENGNQKDDH